MTWTTLLMENYSLLTTNRLRNKKIIYLVYIDLAYDNYVGFNPDLKIFIV